MKLSNKKTGKILEDKCLNYALDDMKQYNSLAELNEEWEDYKPKEPLIKDEKIRKVVRAWAEANKIEYVHYDLECNELNDLARNGISFNAPILERKLLVDRDYTITELCGEEEE